jgi:hypothetical protein
MAAFADWSRWTLSVMRRICLPPMRSATTATGRGCQHLPESVEATAHWIAGKVNDDALVPYAVIDLRAEQAVGLVSYMAIEREMGTVEIGHVTWSRR